MINLKKEVLKSPTNFAVVSDSRKEKNLEVSVMSKIMKEYVYDVGACCPVLTFSSL